MSQSLQRWWRTLLGVLAGFFGVQSDANRERDFREGRTLHFIIIGLVMAVLFALFVILLVRLALSLSGV